MIAIEALNMLILSQLLRNGAFQRSLRPLIMRLKEITATHDMGQEL